MKVTRNPLFCLLLTPWLSVVAQEPDDSTLLIDAHRTAVESLEREIGRYDQRLVEPLLSLAQTTMELDQFDETADILDRAIQITRLNEGLYTNSQAPLLLQSIKNETRRGNWRDANETLEHLAWLYSEKFVAPIDVWWSNMMELVDLHLEGFIRDREENQASHLSAATGLTQIAIRMARRDLADSDPRLAELYYRQLRNLFLETAAIERGGATSYRLREASARSSRFAAMSFYGADGFPSMISRSNVEQRKVAVNANYRSGLYLLRLIRDVYEAADPPALEAMAMVNIYAADWSVMYDKPQAGPSYLVAYQDLLRAGVARERLDLLLSKPQVLPIDKFYSSVELALENTEFVPDSEASTSSRADLRADIRFSEWSPGFPNFRSPVVTATLHPEEIADYETARLLITLNGVQRVSKWVNGRYVSQTSVPEQFELVAMAQSETARLDDLSNRMHYLFFRPSLSNGVPQRFEGVLDYHYFTGWDD